MRIKIFSGKEDLPKSSPLPTPVERENQNESIQQGTPLTELLQNSDSHTCAKRLRTLRTLNHPVDAHGNTPLHLAVFHNDLPLVFLLLTKGADPNVENHGGKTPLDISKMLNFEKVSVLLWKHGAIDSRGDESCRVSSSSETSSPRSQLSPSELMVATQSVFTAAFLGLTWHVVPHLNISTINSTDDAGHTILMKACYSGHIGLVEQLTEKGADIKVKDKTGFNCLAWACLMGWVEITKFLVEKKGMDINGGEGTALTPLFVAVFSGHLDVVIYLIQQNVNLNPRCRVTPLMVACWMGHVEIVDVLIRAKALIPQPFTLWYQKGFQFIQHFRRKYSDIELPATHASATVVSDDYVEIEQLLTKASPATALATKDYVKSVPTKVAKQISAEMSEELDKASSSAKINRRSKSNGCRHYRPTSGSNAHSRRHIEWADALKESGLNNYSDMILELVSTVPTLGTELDSRHSTLIQYIVQLICAVKEDAKQQFIARTIKIVSQVKDIIGMIEYFEHASSAKSKSADTNDTATSPPTPTSTAKPSKFSHSQLVRDRTFDLIKNLQSKYATELVKSTRLATGVWPPPESVPEMLNAAKLLALSCRQLIDVANTTGYWAVMDISLDPAGTFGSDQANSPTRKLDFSEYKRQNDMKMIDDLAKSYEKNPEQAEPEIDPVEAFNKGIENLTTQFVQSVKYLKIAKENNQKSDYLTASSAIHARADAIVDEINSNELFLDIPLSIVREDGPVRHAIKKACDEVMTFAADIHRKATLACGVWPPPEAAQEMLNVTVQCVAALKKLTNLAKEAALLIRQTENKERLKKDEWKRQFKQNEAVRKMFSIWENAQRESAGEMSELSSKTGMTAEEIAFLDDNPEGLILDTEPSGKRIVKGGRLTKLVERLTYHLSPDNEYMAAFIMTHHSFTTSSDLLDLLIRRYDITPPYGLNQKQFELYLKKKIMPVRLRVINVLKFWTENYVQDFLTDDKSAFIKLKEFIGTKIINDFPSMAEQLFRLLTNKLDDKHKSRQSLNDLSAVYPKPIIPRNMDNLTQLIKQDPYYFMEIDPLELARQMTLIDFSYYKDIVPKECLNQIWGRTHESSSTKAPNVNKLINQTNKITIWVAKSMVSQSILKHRVSVLKYFMTLAITCRELNNFNALTSVVAGLTMGPVFRMKKTWLALDKSYPKLREQYNQCIDVVSPKGQYANYRKVLRTTLPPLIPFMGVYLTDLTFIEDGNPDFLPDSHFINFEKRRKVAMIIREIQAYQTTYFTFELLDTIQEFLKNLQEVNEQELYRLSLIAEPREEEPDD